MHSKQSFDVFTALPIVSSLDGTNASSVGGCSILGRRAPFFVIFFQCHNADISEVSVGSNECHCFASFSSEICNRGRRPSEWT